MEFFNIAKKVRLRSHLNKYLYAYEDEESVILIPRRKGSYQNACWTVEFNDDKKIRLKSCYGRYLAASYRTCCGLMGMITGLNVVHTEAEVVCSSWVEWEPIREGHLVKLKTRYGNFLRANDGGIPPWRNSVIMKLFHLGRRSRIGSCGTLMYWRFYLTCHRGCNRVPIRVGRAGSEILGA